MVKSNLPNLEPSLEQRKVEALESIAGSLEEIMNISMVQLSLMAKAMGVEVLEEDVNVVEGEVVEDFPSVPRRNVN